MKITGRDSSHTLETDKTIGLDRCNTSDRRNSRTLADVVTSPPTENQLTPPANRIVTPAKMSLNNYIDRAKETKVTVEEPTPPVEAKKNCQHSQRNTSEQ